MRPTKWSFTKLNTLRQCTRKFFFAHILQSHGRKNRLRRKAYELKHMKNLDMWQGTVVDIIMSTVVIPAITAKDELDFYAFAEQAVELAQKQYTYSEKKIYQLPSYRKNKSEDDGQQEQDKQLSCILDIHELGKEITIAQINEVYDKISESIINIPEIKMPDGKTLLIDFLQGSFSLLPDMQAWFFDIEGIRVNPQIDLIGYNRYKPYIIDWKVSESLSSDYFRQLLIAGLTVYFKRLEKESEGKKPYEFKDIRLFKVNLLKATVEEYIMDEDSVNELIDTINLTGGDMEMIESSCAPEAAVMEALAPSENEANCLYCNYKSLCSYLYLNNHVYDEKDYLQSIQIAEPAGA